MKTEVELHVVPKEDGKMRSDKDKLCYVSDAEQLRSLTKGATMSCAKCGAKSNNPATLCEPIQVGDINMFGD